VKNDVKSILMVGVGGQGIITSSDILTMAAIYSGYDAKKNEIHGMSQRGGSVFSHIRFGKKVYSSVIPLGQADILMSLEQMETLRWIKYANALSTVITTKIQIKPPMVDDYPLGIEDEIKRLCKNLIFIDTEALKNKIENIKYINVALLGIMSNYISFADDAFKKAIKDKVPEQTFDANWNAFIVGKNYNMEEM